MNNKTDLRITAKELRKKLPIDEISQKLVQIIRNDDFYICAKNVMIFYPTKYEINLLELLDDEKKFFLPKVEEDNLIVCPFKKNDKLLKSNFNIFEPCTLQINPEKLDLVIVPALMADKRGFRLGYGKGFYDRFLKRYKNNFKTITVVPKELFVPELPCDEFDEKIDKILTI